MTRRRVTRAEAAAGVALAALLAAAGSAAAERRVAVIVDTSGSMESSDRPRYTLQVSRILADLLAPDDAMTVVTMRGGGLFTRCSAGVDRDLAVRFDPAAREDFARRLDERIRYGGGNAFAAPIRTAVDVLGHDPAHERLLLIVADSGGLAGCETELEPDLLRLRRSGAVIAAVNLGSTAGAFDSHPAFELTAPALDARAMVDAVALVYQRFLGAKKVQTGSVGNDVVVEVEVAPYVEEAFLVVAADGPVPRLVRASPSPGAKDLALDYRGGGATVGLDGKERGYRMARLTAPEAGTWRFSLPGLRDPAGWMLIQDSAVALRLLSTSVAAADGRGLVEAELYDRRTGRRIEDPAMLRGLSVTVEAAGQSIALRDDGSDGDRAAGDGVLSGRLPLAGAGAVEASIHLESDWLDRTLREELQVVEAGWRLEPAAPPRAEVGEPAPLAVRLEPFGDPAHVEPPERVVADAGGATIPLRDDGSPPDEVAGDRTFGGRWTPAQIGEATIEYRAEGGSPSLPAPARVEVVGRLDFGAVPAIDFGELAARETRFAELDLRSAEVRGRFDVVAATELELAGAVLEIADGEAWRAVGAEPQPLVLADGGERRFTLRLRAGRCPRLRREASVLRLSAAETPAGPRTIEVPLLLAVRPEPWWRCWWPVLATAAATCLGAVVVHGFVSPSRFARGMKVLISPEDDLDDLPNVPPIRAARGTGSGFYRDARTYVVPHSLAARPGGAIARLRADGKRIRILPLSSVWRRNVDDEWERLPDGESLLRPGTVYRDERGSLFFTVRAG